MARPRARGAGLAIEYVAEPGDRPIPVVLAIRARKPEALPPKRVS